jgi:hypothetical protein
VPAGRRNCELAPGRVVRVPRGRVAAPRLALQEPMPGSACRHRSGRAGGRRIGGPTLRSLESRQRAAHKRRSQGLKLVARLDRVACRFEVVPGTRFNPVPAPG